jgi:hypothetical protein
MIAAARDAAADHVAVPFGGLDMVTAGNGEMQNAISVDRGVPGAPLFQDYVAFRHGASPLLYC